MGKRLTALSDLTPDPNNANRGTERGRALLEHSLRQYGAGRSVLADKHGTLIAGNKTIEVAAELGLPIRIVETDGTELVVVRRRDLDLAKDKAARELAYADNRAGELSLDWDVEQVQADLASGIDLDVVGFSAAELETLLARADEPEHTINNKSDGYDFSDINPAKLAYRVEAAWRAAGDLAIDLFSGQGQLAVWYERRFSTVIRVDRSDYNGVTHIMSAQAFLASDEFAHVAHAFDFVDLDDEGSPLNEVMTLFAALPADRQRPFVLCITDGSGLNLKFHGLFNPALYGLDGAVRRATTPDYERFDALVTSTVNNTAVQHGWVAEQWSSIRGSEGNVVYQTYAIRRDPDSTGTGGEK